MKRNIVVRAGYSPSNPRFTDNSESAEKDDWRCYEASRPDSTRHGVKCFDCFEWRCRVSITRRRLDVDTGTFGSRASRSEHCARINLDSRRGNRTQSAIPDVSIRGTHAYPDAEKGLTRQWRSCSHSWLRGNRSWNRAANAYQVFSLMPPDMNAQNPTIQSKI